jgi:hypothetical protein
MQHFGGQNIIFPVKMLRISMDFPIFAINLRINSTKIGNKRQFYDRPTGQKDS